jgi:hypothetical protein
MCDRVGTRDRCLIAVYTVNMCGALAMCAAYVTHAGAECDDADVAMRGDISTARRDVPIFVVMAIFSAVGWASTIVMRVLEWSWSATRVGLALIMWATLCASVLALYRLATCVHFCAFGTGVLFTELMRDIVALNTIWITHRALAHDSRVSPLTTLAVYRLYIQHPPPPRTHASAPGERASTSIASDVVAS